MIIVRSPAGGRVLWGVNLCWMCDFFYAFDGHAVCDRCAVGAVSAGFPGLAL